MGCSVFDYVHPGDHAELAEQLGMKLPPNKTSSSSPSSTNADGNSTSGSGAGSPAAIGPSVIQGGYIYIYIYILSCFSYRAKRRTMFWFLLINVYLP